MLGGSTSSGDISDTGLEIISNPELLISKKQLDENRKIKQSKLDYAERRKLRKQLMEKQKQLQEITKIRISKGHGPSYASPEVNPNLTSEGDHDESEGEDDDEEEEDEEDEDKIENLLKNPKVQLYLQQKIEEAIRNQKEHYNNGDIDYAIKMVSKRNRLRLDPDFDPKNATDYEKREEYQRLKEELKSKRRKQKFHIPVNIVAKTAEGVLAKMKITKLKGLGNEIKKGMHKGEFDGLIEYLDSDSGPMKPWHEGIMGLMNILVKTYTKQEQRENGETVETSSSELSSSSSSEEEYNTKEKRRMMRRKERKKREKKHKGKRRRKKSSKSSSSGRSSGRSSTSEESEKEPPKQGPSAPHPYPYPQYPPYAFPQYPGYMMNGNMNGNMNGGGNMMHGNMMHGNMNGNMMQGNMSEFAQFQQKNYTQNNAQNTPPHSIPPNLPPLSPESSSSSSSESSPVPKKSFQRASNGFVREKSFQRASNGFVREKSGYQRPLMTQTTRETFKIPEAALKKIGPLLDEVSSFSAQTEEVDSLEQKIESINLLG